MDYRGDGMILRATLFITGHKKIFVLKVGDNHIAVFIIYKVRIIFQIVIGSLEHFTDNFVRNESCEVSIHAPTRGATDR